MPTLVDRIYQEAMKLSQEAREELTGRLLDSLDAHRESGLDLAAAREIRRRLQDLKSGRVKGHSLSEAMDIIMDDSDEPSRSGQSPARDKRRKARTPLVRKA